VDIRIIAATNKDLPQAIIDKSFREDLYYRLKVFQIVLPPLRNHPEDIPYLTDHFLSHFNRQFRKCIKNAQDEVKQLLMQYKWPGNIRELRNVIERAVILETDAILHTESLPQEIVGLSSGTLNHISPPGNHLTINQASGEGSVSLYDIEKQTIIQALQQENSNQTRAAKRLGITRDTLRYKMKKYNLH
jgi:transcriptional regulator with PAS, ATPase and Fis domain